MHEQFTLSFQMTFFQDVSVDLNISINDNKLTIFKLGEKQDSVTAHFVNTLWFCILIRIKSHDVTTSLPILTLTFNSPINASLLFSSILNHKYFYQRSDNGITNQFFLLLLIVLSIVLM